MGSFATPHQAAAWKRRAGTPERDDWARRRTLSSREPATPPGDRSDSPRGRGGSPPRGAHRREAGRPRRTGPLPVPAATRRSAVFGRLSASRGGITASPSTSPSQSGMKPSSFAARPADVASANANRRDRVEPPIERRSATGTQGAGRTSRGLVLADKVPAIDDAKRLGVGERDALTALAFLPATTYGVARTARRRTEERAMASKLGKRRSPSRSSTLPRR